MKWFGIDSNEKELKRLQPLVEKINALEAEYRHLSDEALKAKTAEFKARVAEAIAPVKAKAEQQTGEIQKEIADINKPIGVAVICSEMQRPFLEWLECRVVASYGRPEELTSSQLITMIKKARKEHIVLVADNLQSGPQAGKTLAEEAGARHVTLTNFPLSGSYITDLKNNIRKILKETER